MGEKRVDIMKNFYVYKRTLVSHKYIMSTVIQAADLSSAIKQVNDNNYRVLGCMINGSYGN